MYSIQTFKKKTTRKNMTLIAREVSKKDESIQRYVYITKKNLDDEDDDNFTAITNVKAEKGCRFQNVPIITDNNTVSQYISGPSNSGKSYYANQQIRELLNHPRFKTKYTIVENEKGKKIKEYDPNIWIITQSENFNDVYEEHKQSEGGHGIIWLPVDSEYFDALDWTSVPENSIVVADDLDGISDKHLAAKVTKFLQGLLQNTRMKDIATLQISHFLRGGQRTKSALFECPYAVLFPNDKWTSVKKFLKDILQFDKETIEDIDKIRNRTRALVIHTSAPTFYLTDSEIQLIE